MSAQFRPSHVVVCVTMSEIRRTADLIVWWVEGRGGTDVKAKIAVEGDSNVATVSVRYAYTPRNSLKMKNRNICAWVSPTGNIIRTSASFPKTGVRDLGKMLSHELPDGRLVDFSSPFGRDILSKLRVNRQTGGIGMNGSVGWIWDSEWL